MTNDMEQFFLELQNPNYLAMKLLLAVFNRMKISDDSSKKIIDNVGAFSHYNISLIDSKSPYNYVSSNTDLSNVVFAISGMGTEYFACHEFGHLLLEVFARGELPENYSQVNALCIKRLMEREEDVARMLRGFSFEVFQKLVEDINRPVDFLDRHPELVDDYLKKSSDKNRSDLLGTSVSAYFKFLSTFDRRTDDYNRVSSIIDAMFHGNNPFYSFYGNFEFFPVIAMHDVEYYLENDNGPILAGFEEQFADYLVLKLYGDEMCGTVNTVHNLVGNEWFDMMDKFYDIVADRVALKEGVSQKGYQYKK